LREDKPWAAKGYEIAERSVSLTGLPVCKSMTIITRRLLLMMLTPYTLSGNNFEIRVDKTNGALNSYVQGQQQVFAPLCYHILHGRLPIMITGDGKPKKTKAMVYQPAPVLKNIKPNRSVKGLVKINSTYTLINDSASVKGYLYHKRKWYYQMLITAWPMLNPCPIFPK
jgi:beta-galactosidase